MSEIINPVTPRTWTVQKFNISVVNIRISKIDDKTIPVRV